MAAVFVAVVFWPLSHGQGLRAWAEGVALLFALAALANSKLFSRLSRGQPRLRVLLCKRIAPMLLLEISRPQMTSTNWFARCLNGTRRTKD